MELAELHRMFPTRAVGTRKRRVSKNGRVTTRKASPVDLLFFGGASIGDTLSVKPVTPDNPAIPVVKSRWWPGMLDQEGENSWAFINNTGGTTKL